MRKGFTVTEILITVVVFALLLGFTVPKFIVLVHKAQEGSTKHKLVKVRSAIERLDLNSANDNYSPKLYEQIMELASGRELADLINNLNFTV